MGEMDTKRQKKCSETKHGNVRNTFWHHIYPGLLRHIPPHFARLLINKFNIYICASYFITDRCIVILLI